MTKQTNRPTHGLYVVQGEGEKAFWTKIGAAWPNQDGKGYSQSFTAFPISGRVVMRELTTAEAAQEGAG